jgi:hypothetical protein
MGAGTDVARESADVVLIGNDLMKFVETVRITRNCRRIISRISTALSSWITIGICLAAVGLLNPLLAAFIHVASELTFILNSTRLLPPTSRLWYRSEDGHGAELYRFRFGEHNPRRSVVDSCVADSVLLHSCSDEGTHLA